MKQRLLFLLLLGTSILFASYKTGDTLPEISLPDQFETQHTIEKSDRMVLLSFEKEVSGIMKAYLEKQPKGFLTTHHTKYISDISAMPSFVTAWFAIPKMKKYPFPVMLIYDDLGKAFSHEEGKVTVYHLKGRKVQRIEFVDPEALKTLFQ